MTGTQKTEKIKILHIINSFGIGGLENGLVNIINHSDDQIFSHEICCIKKSGKSASRLNKPIIVSEMKRKGGLNPFFVFKLAYFILTRRPDIVHTRSWSGIDGIIAAKLARIKNIIHGEHGWSPDDPKGTCFKKRIIRRVTFFFVCVVIAVSEDIKQWLNISISVPEKKIKRIVNGVDVSVFSPVNDLEKNNNFKKIYSIPTDKLILGIVARFDPIKRHDLLFKALHELNDENLVLIVIGGGANETRFTEMIKKMELSDNVFLLGERDNLQSFYNIFDVFVLPSDNEGISNTILEAMSCGLPIITTAIGGNIELVKNQKNGLLIEPGNQKSLENAIKFYQNHPEKIRTHGAHSRLLACNEFSIHNMIDKYLNIYKNINRRC